MSGLRVAVGLPTLPQEARHRAALDGVLAALHAQGVDIEAFAERPRDRDGDEPFPVYHYLRLGERHRHRRFDTGLYLLGRDMRVYEPPYLLMRQYPGLAWVLDPVVHHLLIGGIVVWGRWDEYRDMLEEAFGPEEGSAVATTVSSGWGIRSLYRRRDPAIHAAASQPGVVAATPGIRRALQAAGADAPVVPLPAPVATAHAAPSAPRRIVVLALNYAWPEPALSGLAAVLAGHDDVDIAVCVPEIILTVGMRFPRRAERLRERVRWLPAGDWPGLAASVDTADLVVHLRDDPTVGERVLMEEAMAAGKPVVVLAADDLAEYPDSAVMRVAGGRALGVSVATGIDTLMRDAELAAALGGAGRDHVAGRPDAGAVAGRLAGALDAAASQGFEPRPISDLSWGALRRSALARVCPASADGEQRALFEERVRAGVPAALRSRLG